MNVKGSNFTNFQNIRLRGTSGLGGRVLLTGAGFDSTLSVSTAQEADARRMERWAHRFAFVAIVGYVLFTTMLVVWLRGY